MSFPPPRPSSSPLFSTYTIHVDPKRPTVAPKEPHIIWYPSDEEGSSPKAPTPPPKRPVSAASPVPAAPPVDSPGNVTFWLSLHSFPTTLLILPLTPFMNISANRPVMEAPPLVFTANIIIWFLIVTISQTCPGRSTVTLESLGAPCVERHPRRTSGSNPGRSANCNHCLIVPPPSPDTFQSLLLLSQLSLPVVPLVRLSLWFACV